MHPFSIPWKHQKAVRFSDVFRGQRKGALRTNGLILILHIPHNEKLIRKTLYSVKTCCKQQRMLITYLLLQILPFLLSTTKRSSRSQIFFKIGALRNSANFTGIHQWWSLFVIKLQAFRTATLLKRYSNTSVFLWNFRNF